MDDLKSRLAALASGAVPSSDALERAKRRAASRRRRRQVGTISLAMLVALVGVVGAVRGFVTTRPTPASRQPTGTVIFIRSQGREVLFGHDTLVHARPRVMSLRLPDGGITALTDGRRQVKDPVVSPDGSRIAVSVGRSTSADTARWQTYTMNADGSDLTQMFACPGTRFCDSIPITWSPDGEAIAIYSDVGGRPALWLVNSETGSRRRLIGTGGYFGGASWAPDGATIALAGGRFGSPKITFVNARTGAIERQVRPADVKLASGLAWSPRSGAIAFSGETTADSASIFVIRVADASIARVTRCESCEDTSPAWSDDGRFIAFARGSYFSADVYVVGSDGARLRRLTSGAGVDCCVSWTAATSVTVPSPADRSGPSGTDIGLPWRVCNVESMRGDVNGDATPDTVWTGTILTSHGRCSSSVSRHRVLAIDTNGDRRADVSSTRMNCETWCGLYALADLNDDGTKEILINEGHLWAPESAVLGVYELVGRDFMPIRFPDPPGDLHGSARARANQFSLFDSWQGYDGAYCDGGSFVTWQGFSTPDGGSIRTVKTTTYALNTANWRFEKVRTDVQPGHDLPHRTGWSVLCGSRTNGM